MITGFGGMITGFGGMITGFGGMITGPSRWRNSGYIDAVSTHVQGRFWGTS